MNAPEKATEIKAALAAVIAFCTALWGWLGWTILVWVFCFVLDYLSGTAAARKAGEWSSAAAREGLWHKLGEIFAVLVAALCDIALKIVVGSGLQLGFELPALITPVVLLWYILTALGSDAAIESADIVLMDDKPSRLPLAIRLARRTMRIVHENIVFALAVKFGILILSAFGLTNMWWAVFGDVGVLILAILNAMRCMLRLRQS